MRNSFSNRMVITGFNNYNSLMTSYVNQVNASGEPPSNWDNYGAGLAYDVDLIFWDSISPTNQRWAADMENGGVNQVKTVETYGSSNETVLSAAANISNKFFLGVTFAFPYIRYHEDSRLTENHIKSLNSYFAVSYTHLDVYKRQGNNTYPDTNYAASQYYDESYEARINRFDEPYVSTSYYSDIYTAPYYYYDPSPVSYTHLEVYKRQFTIR